jgi:hypothetical protein
MHDEDLPTIDMGADGYVICSNCGSHIFTFDTFGGLAIECTRTCSLCGTPKPYPQEVERDG